MVDLESKESCEPWGEIKQKVKGLFERLSSSPRTADNPDEKYWCTYMATSFRVNIQLNFDATIFSKLNNFGVGAIICNEKGDKMCFRTLPVLPSQIQNVGS